MPSVEARLLVRPLYLQVRDVLVSQIAAGEWKPGGSLPNETLLAQKLGISIGTVRKALDIMEDERIVTRRQGRGTFVNDYSANPLLLSSFVGRNGSALLGEKREKSLSRLSADAETAARLGISIGAPIISVDRIRYNEGKPFMTETCWLPAALYPALPENLAGYRLSVLAQLNAIIVGRAQEAVTAVAATEPIARDLNVPPGTPVLGLDRTVFSDKGAVLEWRIARSFMRSERFMVILQ